MNICLLMVPVCDRQTDGQTDCCAINLGTVHYYQTQANKLINLINFKKYTDEEEKSENCPVTREA